MKIRPLTSYLALAAFAAVGTTLVLSSPQASAQFPGIGDDSTQSLGQFKIAVNPIFQAALDASGDPNWSIPLKRYTSPLLYDATTTIGRSAPLLNGDLGDLGGVPVGTLGTIVKDADFGITPPAFLAAPPGTREVHTEIAKLNMVSFGGPVFAVRAGPGLGGAPTAPKSLGEVMSNNTGGIGNPLFDFPASSFFDIFVQIDLPFMPGNPLYNSTPLVVENPALLAFPPTVLYTHGETSAVELRTTFAIPAFAFGALQPTALAAGDVFGIVLLAGHGVNYSPGGGSAGGGNAQTKSAADFQSEIQIQQFGPTSNELHVDPQYVTWAPGLTPTPEPSTGLLAAVGLLGWLGARRRRDAAGA